MGHILPISDSQKERYNDDHATTHKRRFASIRHSDASQASLIMAMLL
jgi:hypothetical protein